ncbi:MAG: hypothetical protein LEGION0403_FIIPPAGN_01725 [Legionella sp.]
MPYTFYALGRFAEIYKMVLNLEYVVCLLFEQKGRATSRQGNGFFDKPISLERIKQADMSVQDTRLVGDDWFL